MDTAPKDYLISVRVTQQDRKELERIAAMADRPMGWIVRKVITDWLKRQQKASK